MGQAVGICAALAARNEVLPQQVPFAEVRDGLLGLGAVPLASL